MNDQTEKAFDADLFVGDRALAKRLGWASYHTLRSKGAKAGYPDRTIWRDRVLFVELKAQKGAPTDLQVVTLTQLAKAGAEVYLWRPSDLDEIGQILGRRWSFDTKGDWLDAEGQSAPALRFSDGSRLCPDSSWLASGGRRDGR